MINVQRRPLIEFAGDIVHKVGDASLLVVEATKTTRAGEIGKESGLFYVPRVLDFDREKGVLELERLNGLVTLLQLARDKDTRLLELLGKAGRALAVVHEQLVLPENMKYGLPPEWMDSLDENVFIHGDFTIDNMCLHTPSDQLVILDWSTAPLLGRTPSFGSRYFDILWFASRIFDSAPYHRALLGWDAEGMAEAFVRGYIKVASAEKLNHLKDYWPEIMRLQRKILWNSARTRPLHNFAVCIIPRIIMYLRLRNYMRRLA